MAATGEAQAPPKAEAQPFTPLPIAGLQMRIVAFLLDGIVVTGLVMFFFAVGFGQAALRYDDPPSSALWLGAAITAAAIFPVTPLLFAFLWAWRSQSLGMMAVGVIITTRSGYRISHTRALLRAVLWLLSIVPLCAGMFPLFFDPERRALHDRLAGTVVRELR
jgi:uncharacterized RDD family membrane protein YckC